MRQFFLIPVVYLLSQFTVVAAGPPDGYYLAELRIEQQVFRLLLHPGRRSLRVVGMRAYPVPVRWSRVKGDSIRFGRTDSETRFRGVYVPEKKCISGTWEEAGGTPVNIVFFRVNPDTVRGYRPKTRIDTAYAPPVAAKDGIAVSTLRSVRMCDEPIRSLSLEIQKGGFGFVHSLLISRSNNLVFEDYYYGFDADVPFGIQSVTKSFVSALTGIAVERGELSVNDTLCAYMKKYENVACTQANKGILLRSVLTMSTGFDWDESTYEYGHKRNSLTVASQQDPFTYLFTRKRSPQPVFAYNSINHMVMNMVLSQATGLSNTEELNTRLMIPLGITNYDPGEADDNGLLGDIALRARDMLKFGHLYLNDGYYEGRQILSAEWVKQSTETLMKSGRRTGYGYFWWTTTFNWQGNAVKSFFAWGYGGQYIFVVPELDLVVVMNGTNWNTNPRQYAFDMMDRFIIPACEPSPDR